MGQKQHVRRTSPCPLSTNSGHFAVLLDHLVGATEQRRRHGDAERLSGLEVEHEFIFVRRLHRQVGGLLTFEDAIGVAARAVKLVDGRAVGNQAAAETKKRSY